MRIGGGEYGESGEWGERKLMASWEGGQSYDGGVRMGESEDGDRVRLGRVKRVRMSRE